MSATSQVVPSKTIVAKVTSKGQITIPVEIRKLLGAKAGDKLAFEPTADGVKMVRQSGEDRFEKFRGFGNGIAELDGGIEGIVVTCARCADMMKSMMLSWAPIDDCRRYKHHDCSHCN